MAGERKRKLSLFDVVDEANGSDKTKLNGGGPAANPYTGRPYSAKYYEILEKRRTLPVWQQKAEFLSILAKNQTMILVGETGSGKTTQVCFLDLFFLSIPHLSLVGIEVETQLMDAMLKAHPQQAVFQKHFVQQKLSEARSCHFEKFMFSF